MRILLTILLPLLGPLVLYLLWMSYVAKRRRDTGEDPPELTKGMLFIALSMGGVLSIVVLVTVALLGAGDTTSEYVPPRQENGRIIPGHYK
jgi:hypothetical protein